MRGPRGSVAVARPDELAPPDDGELRQGIELLFFAYRDFTGDPDAVLAVRGLGRAHHRAIHFINRRPGLTVAGLPAIPEPFSPRSPDARFWNPFCDSGRS